VHGEYSEIECMVSIGVGNRRRSNVKQKVGEGKKMRNFTASFTCGYARYSVCDICGEFIC
jgi:hypothetical protein